MTRLTYDEARNVIQDGDIVFINGSWRDPISAAVMFFTASTYSHVCIAFWVPTAIGRLLMCVEAQGRTRRRIFPLSYYADQTFTVVAAPKSWDDVKHNALSKVGHADYGMIEAIYVGLREFVARTFGYSLPIRPHNKEYCSALVAAVYGLPDVHGSPQVLYDQLLTVSSTREVQSTEESPRVYAATGAVDT